MPTARWGAAGGVIDGKFYVAGGHDGNYVASTTLQVLTPAETCQQQLQDIQEQFGAVTSQNAQLQNQLAAANSEIARLQGQVAALTQQNQALTTQTGQPQSQIRAMNSGLGNIQQTLAQLFSDPQFVIPGATPLEQYQHLVSAILRLNRGRLQGLYMNLGGK